MRLKLALAILAGLALTAADGGGARAEDAQSPQPGGQERQLDPDLPGVGPQDQKFAETALATLGTDREGRLVYFMTIDSARFRKPVVPGDTLHVHVEKQRNRGNVWKFSGRAKVGDVLVAEATYAAMIRDS
jgi:3-hydroxymyristoyl/3-hydroxydecanoyl-(acyl carrier protein) dehydratase